MDDPKQVVLDFNECINTGDLQGLSALMSEDHTFIDSSDEIHRGKRKMVEGWTQFFAAYPDYRNYFNQITSRGNLVLVTGYSTCSFDPLDGPAIWTAEVENGLVKEWRVYLDSPENREKLGLDD